MHILFKYTRNFFQDRSHVRLQNKSQTIYDRNAIKLSFQPQNYETRKKDGRKQKEVEKKNKHLETKQHVAKKKQTSKNQQVNEEIPEENRKCLRANKKMQLFKTDRMLQKWFLKRSLY